MPETQITVAGQVVPAGAIFTARLAGSIPTYLTAAVYKNNLQVQLLMQGISVDALTVDTNTGVITHDYTGTLRGYYSAKTSVDGIVSMVRTAAENAGSYAPTASVISYGQADQPTLPNSAFDDVGNSIVDAVSGLFKGLGGLFRGVGASAEEVPKLPYLLVGGIVLLGAFIAFGPTFKGAGKAAASRIPV